MTFQYSRAHGAGDYLKSTLVFVRDHCNGKLKKANRAEKEAKELGVKPEDIFGSTTGYLCSSKRFLEEHGVELPNITKFRTLVVGAEDQCFPLGIYDKATMQPVLFKEDVVTYIHSDHELAALKGDPKRCAAAIKAKGVCGPSAPALASILLEYRLAVSKRRGDLYENVAPIEAAMAEVPVKFQAGNGMTATQKAELKVKHGEQRVVITQALVESMQGQRANREVLGNMTATTDKAIEGFKKAIDSNNENRKLMAEAMKKEDENTAMLANLLKDHIADGKELDRILEAPAPVPAPQAKVKVEVVEENVVPLEDNEDLSDEEEIIPDEVKSAPRVARAPVVHFNDNVDYAKEAKFPNVPAHTPRPKKKAVFELPPVPIHTPRAKAAPTGEKPARRKSTRTPKKPSKYGV